MFMLLYQIKIFHKTLLIKSEISDKWWKNKKDKKIQQITKMLIFTIINKTIRINKWRSKSTHDNITNYFTHCRLYKLKFSRYQFINAWLPSCSKIYSIKIIKNKNILHKNKKRYILKGYIKTILRIAHNKEED